MKSILKNSLLVGIIFSGFNFYAQNAKLDNYRQPDKNGVNIFEAPKDTVSNFDGVKVKVGGAFALQYQALENENSGAVPLKEIGANFNLATANWDLDVALFDGVNLHLRTYLSSRHHNEPYVKGGYFQIDKLDFVHEGFLGDLMRNTTIKIGHMENNYGDAHFRRSDNAETIYNPFVGNLIMDAFTTEVGAEVYYRTDGGFIGMLGFSNGKLNQSVEKTNGSTGGGSLLAKLGYDKQLDEDLRIRLTGSLYNTGYAPNVYLYNADRAGSRYYDVLQDQTATSDNFRSGRFNPGFANKITAVMINPFVKYNGLEFFGTVELTSGRSLSETDRRNTQQYAGELVYRFGNSENFYLGGRYNMVEAELLGGNDVSIDRFQLSGGWFMTKNVLLKAEYVVQNYNDYAVGDILEDGKFNGIIAEAVISF